MLLNSILSLDIPEEFGKAECDTLTESLEYVMEQLKVTQNSGEVTWGSTKFIIFLNDKQVIKIPFNGVFTYDDEFYYHVTENYCQVEEEIYKRAKEKKLDYYFTEVKKVGETKNKVPIYISERVKYLGKDYDCDNIIITDELYRKINSIKKSFSFLKTSYIHLTIPWIAAAIQYYGEQSILDLLNFIEDEDINDLHDENIGFRADGTPVILDYSGYDEE